MLTRHDDMLCHQFPRPFENVSQSDPNWVERIHFPVVSADASTIIDVGFGYYPNRDVMDGFAGIARGTDVRYVRGSRALRPRIDEVFVGPLRWDVVEGLKTIRCTLEPNDAGIAWDLLYEASFPVSGEEYHELWRSGRKIEEQIRFYQMGGVSGWLEVDGVREEVSPATFRANRDRSWGVRQPLVPDPTAKPHQRATGGLYSFVYIQFDDWAVQHHRVDDIDGNPTFHFAERHWPDRIETLPTLAHQAVMGPDWTPRSGAFTYTGDDGTPFTIEFERGTGIFPTGAVGGYSGFRGFNQGRWMGEEWIDAGRIDLAVGEEFKEVFGLFDFACTVHCGDQTGVAIVECIPFGAYRPYGLGV
jgi:hypothetical protein